VLAAVIAVALAGFPTDWLWGGGLTGLVAVVMGALAFAVRTDSTHVTPCLDTRPGGAVLSESEREAPSGGAAAVDVLGGLPPARAADLDLLHVRHTLVP
jgi:hypothetical protein